MTPSSARARLIALAQIGLAAATLLWPLLVVGRPTLFADTGGYWRQGRTMVVQGLGLDRTAPNPFDLTLDAQVVDHEVIRDPRIGSSFIAARSPIYGVFLYASQRLGTLWLTAALQALAAAAVIRVVWRAAAPGAARWTYLGLMAGLAAASSLPFYAGFAMPDVFAGLDMLIAAGLTLYWDRLGPWTRGALWLLLAISLSFHGSHLLVAIALAPVAALALWRLGVARRTVTVRTGALVAAIGAAALGGVAANAGLSAVTGMSAHNPPFLTARLLADGPGRTYLRRVCAAGEPFVLCRFKDRPLATSDSILWWNYADQGVFMTSPLPVRLALEAEQPRFVAAVIAADPLGVAGAALRDLAVQLAGVYVDDPLHDPCEMTRFWYSNQSLARTLVVDPERCGANPSRSLPPIALAALHAGALILSGVMIVRLVRRRRIDAWNDEGRLAAATGLIGMGILANAAICGILSGPFARYEARLIWIVPMLGFLTLCIQTAPAFASRRDGLAAGPLPSRS